MALELIIGFVLTFLPVSELRVGLPIIVNYAIKNSIPIFPLFILVLAINILAIFVAFIFLDTAHKSLMKFKFYENSFGRLAKKSQNKAIKLRKRIKSIGYLALMLLVAIPLPGTGAWTGALLSWLLGLDRKNSIIAISAGVIVAGTIVLLLSLGVFAL